MNIRRVFSEVFAQWRSVHTNWIIALSSRIVLLCTLISILFLLWRYPNLPPSVPLWYSRPWGEEQLAHPLWLFVLPAGGLLWLAMGMFVSTYISRGYLIFTQTLFLSGSIVSLMSFIALIKILFLIT